MGRPRCSYALVVIFFVFPLWGPAMPVYADVYDENRCYHKANKAERSIRKLERRESKACMKRFSDIVDGDYMSTVSVLSRNSKKVCWRQAEQKRAFRLGPRQRAARQVEKFDPGKMGALGLPQPVAAGHVDGGAAHGEAAVAKLQSAGAGLEEAGCPAP